MQAFLREISQVNIDNTEINEHMLIFLKELFSDSFDIKKLNFGKDIGQLKRLFLLISSEMSSIRKMAAITFSLICILTSKKSNFLETFGLVPINGKILLTPMKYIFGSFNLALSQLKNKITEVMEFIKDIYIEMDEKDPIIFWGVDAKKLNLSLTQSIVTFRKSDIKKIIENEKVLDEIPDPKFFIIGCSVEFLKKPSLSNHNSHQNTPNSNHQQERLKSVDLVREDGKKLKTNLFKIDEEFGNKSMIYAHKKRISDFCFKLNLSLAKKYHPTQPINTNNSFDSRFSGKPCKPELINSKNIIYNGTRTSRNSFKEINSNSNTDRSFFHSPRVKNNRSFQTSRDHSPNLSFMHTANQPTNGLAITDKHPKKLEKKIFHSKNNSIDHTTILRTEPRQPLTQRNVVNSSSKEMNIMQKKLPESKTEKRSILIKSEKTKLKKSSQNKERFILDKQYFKNLQKLLPKNFEDYSQIMKIAKSNLKSQQLIAEQS